MKKHKLWPGRIKHDRHGYYFTVFCPKTKRFYAGEKRVSDDREARFLMYKYIRMVG